DIDAVAKLKAFLLSLPSPKHIEQVLGFTVLHFAENESPVFNWVLQNQAALAPELDLPAFSKKLVEGRLRGRGWIRGKDFDISSVPPFFATEPPTVVLDSYFSNGERLLLKSTLQIDG
ncbi:MAG: hypothetical protein AAGJ69_09790, partial [Cyanobacteria bacterium J06559_1]